MSAAQTRRQRGVSLIEALIAMAVMAFGMLGIVGVQATLRLNADVAKQRSEALRLAQREIEHLRSFVQILNSVDQDYNNDIATGVQTLTATETGATNTAYTVNRNVTTSALGDPPPRMKMLQVRVGWLDRTGAPQVVELNSVIAGVPPDLAGTLMLAANVDASGNSTRSPYGRSRAIPAAAVPVDAGRSGYVPRDGGGYALLFNNLSGDIKLCQTTATTTATLNAASISNCSSAPAQLLSGTVRFDYGLSQTAATAESPTGQAMDLDVVITLTTTPLDLRGSVCFTDGPPLAGRTLINYSCVVFSDAAGEWSGTSNIQEIGSWTIGASAGQFRVCRYTTDDPSVLPNPNTLHPAVYTRVRSSEVLAGQNFLVIKAEATCPTDVAANPAASNFVNSNTLQHQP